MTIRVLDPGLDPEGEPLALAPALASLAGATIGLLDNTKIGTARFYDHLQTLLRRHGVRVDRAEVVVRTPDSSESQFDRPREDFDRSGTSTGGEPQFGATDQDSSPSWRQAPEDGGAAWSSEAIDTSAQRLAAAERGVSDIIQTWATESSLNLVA